MTLLNLNSVENTRLQPRSCNARNQQQLFTNDSNDANRFTSSLLKSYNEFLSKEKRQANNDQQLSSENHENKRPKYTGNSISKISTTNNSDVGITRRKEDDAVDQNFSKEPLGNERSTIEPVLRLQEILKQVTGTSVPTHAALDLKDFFVDVTTEHITAYKNDVIVAVCEQDIDALREMHRNGRMLQCCNRFGESIIHMAFRRGAVKVVRFLLEEAGISFRVRDDYGRTPLHDAFWTVDPQADLVKMLITKCPDLLLISDKRGFVPLSYVRKEHWGIWCKFLEENSDILLPKELLPESQ